MAYTTTRQCLVCASEFQANTSGVYCSPVCRKHADNTRGRVAQPTIECVICGTSFQRRNKQHKVCGPECREKYKYTKRSGRDRTPKGIKSPTTVAIIGIPCASCARGAPSTHSTSGWECTAYLAAVCKPLCPTPFHYQPLDTTPTP